MNALLRLFSVPTVNRLLACAGGASLLAACAGGSPFATAPVDPSSPVAAEVARMAKPTGEFPHFTDIPPVPTDQRPVAAWGQEARKLENAAAKLERETADNTWTLNVGGAEAFAARAQREAGPAATSDESSRAASEAFARQIRERATPPPSPR